MEKTQCLPGTGCAKTGDVPVMYIGASRGESRESCGSCPLLSRRPMRYSLEHALAQVDQAAERGWRAAVVLPKPFDKRAIRTPGGRLVQVCPAQLHEGVTCNECGQCGGLSTPGPHVGFVDHSTGARMHGATTRPRCYSQEGTPALAHAGIIRKMQAGSDYSLERALRERRASARIFRIGMIGNPWPYLPKAELLPMILRIREEGLRVMCYDHLAWRHPGGQWLRDHAMASCDGMVRE